VSEAGTAGWVRIAWPDTMPRPLRATAADAGWRTRLDEDGATWICRDEHYRRRPALPLRIYRVPGLIGSTRLNFQRLEAWGEPAVSGDEGVPAYLDRQRRSASLVDRLAGLRLEFVMAPPTDLPQLLNDYLHNHLPELQGGIALLVETDLGVYHSPLVLANMMLKAQLGSGFMEAFPADPTVLSGGNGLNSNEWLGGRIFLTPAVNAACPTTLGFVLTGTGGSVILLPPTPIRNPKGFWPVRLPELSKPYYFTQPRLAFEDIGDLTADEVEGFVTWWVGRWNRVLGELLDPATHADTEGYYRPDMMIKRLATLQRLVSCVQGILCDTGVNDFGRMALLFDTLDLCDGIGLGKREVLVAPRRIAKWLEAIRAEVSPSVACVALPRCERGRAALDSLALGFRDNSGHRYGKAASDGEVAALYSALRNAGHGFDREGSEKDNLDELLRHDASVSPDLPDLAWLHLIHMLCFKQWRH
jgi:hypothetical protein